MSQLEKEFLEVITKDCLLAAKSVRKLIFQLRFEPENKELDHKEVAAIAKKELNEDVSDRIGTELKEIIKSLVNKFEAQMMKDEVDVEYLKSNDKKNKGKWQRVYDWLWNYYYPRWSLEKQWQNLVAQANKTDDWLEVTPASRDVKLPTQATIPLKKDIYLQVKWNGDNCYLLLLNQGTSGDKFCICPSPYFAPSAELSGQGMNVPPAGAKAKSMVFEDLGKEHFLGIVMEQPLDLAWLRPNSGELVPALDAGRLHELLEMLEQQGNWELFYKSFEVV